MNSHDFPRCLDEIAPASTPKNVGAPPSPPAVSLVLTMAKGSSATATYNSNWWPQTFLHPLTVKITKNRCYMML